MGGIDIVGRRQRFDRRGQTRVTRVASRGSTSGSHDPLLRVHLALSASALRDTLTPLYPSLPQRSPIPTADERLPHIQGYKLDGSIQPIAAAAVALFFDAPVKPRLSRTIRRSDWEDFRTSRARGFLRGEWG